MNSHWENLKDKEYREGYSESQFDIEFPFQVGRLMASRGLSVDDLVERGIPRDELVGDKEYSRQTMHRLAAIFDVALLITFIPFSELVRRSIVLDIERFVVPSFLQDTGSYPALELLLPHHAGYDVADAEFVFPGQSERMIAQTVRDSLGEWYRPVHERLR
jgi:hypothetical protein